MVANEVYYQQPEFRLQQHPALTESVRCDVCVVGAGFAGLNCALGLVERGVRDVVLIDAEHVGFGASGRNGGFVFGGYSLSEEALVATVGTEDARALYQLTLDGVDLIRHRSKAIDCDANPAGVLLTNWIADDRSLLQKQAFLEKHYGLQWEYLSPGDVRARLATSRYNGALLERNAFHFQPFRYAQGLRSQFVAEGGRVFEQTRLQSWRTEGGAVELSTTQGRITADRVVFCGGGYQQGRADILSNAVLPIATFVMTTEPLGDRVAKIMTKPHAVYDTRFAFDYYRPLPDGRLLWGGRIAGFDASHGRIEQLLRQDLGRVFPQLNGVSVDHVWSGLMGYSRHKMPQVGRLNEQVWHAQAFGGHGVSTSNIGGDLIARAIATGDETWRLFQPFGLVRTYGRAGQLAAQLSYWWYQSADWWREKRFGRPRHV